MSMTTRGESVASIVGQASAWRAVAAALTAVRPEIFNGPGSGMECAVRAIEQMAAKANAAQAINDLFEDHDTWLRVGLALAREFKGGGLGFALWRNCSLLSDKYAGDESMPTLWRSFVKDLEANTTGTPAAELIPFDLEAAKRGEPVITRDGRKVRFFGHVPEAEFKDERVVGVFDGRTEFWCEDGRWREGVTSDEDLFMAPRPMRTIYLNLYDIGIRGHYDNADIARKNAGEAAIAVAYPVQVPDFRQSDEAAK